MKSSKLIPIVAQVAFLLGLASIIYGISLWSRPLAFVIGGSLVAAISFLAGYKSLDSRSRS